MTLESCDFDLRGMLGDVAEAMALKAQSKGLEIILDIARVEQSMVKGDQGRIRQILTNLISNAIKFTDQGEITIRVSAVPAGQSKILLLCSIQDSGIGIPPNKIASLFNSFSQVDASTTRKYGGTGLGLAISKQLCQLMNGDINATSEEGNGSTFEFSIVIEPSQQSQRVMPSVDISKLRILIVDDNTTNLEVLRGQLEHWGAHITQASSGFKALELCQEIVKNKAPLFDIAFLDMQMPVLNGAELGKKIRADQAFNNMKMVMMTSITQGNEVSYFVDIGFNAYFPKPATTSDLFNALAVVLDHNEQLLPPHLVTHNYLQTFIAPKSSLSLLNERDKAKQPPKDYRILLVEDNRVNQQVALGLLKHLSLTADVAVNGLLALQALKESISKDPYTLVLMDCQMPELDGYQATEEIRNGTAGELFKNIPIIAMTANAMEGDKQKCLDAGMTDYVAKPINPEILAQKLRHYLNMDTAINNKNRDASIPSKPDKRFKAINSSEITETLQTKIDTDIVWDRNACLRRVSNNHQLLKNLIAVFIDDTPSMIHSLSELLAELSSEKTHKNESDITNFFEETYQIAHSFKGVTGNLSGIKLYRHAQELEQAARNTQLAEIQKIHSKLINSHQDLMLQLKDFIENTVA